MIMQLFTSLTKAIEGSPQIALGASFVWGILSILLSPCHLSGIPLIVGFMSGQSKLTFKKAFLISLLFAMGILITIALVGFLTGLLGRMMGDIGIWGNLLVALIFFMVGLYLLDIIRFSFLDKINRPQFHQRGYFAAFFLGLVFGIAVGPCTFAYMAPMLAVVFSAASARFIYAISLIAAYALGHCLIIIIAGSSFEFIQKYLDWNEQSKTPVIIKKICGVLVISGGIYLVFGIIKIYI